MTEPDPISGIDPVLERRARVARLTQAGKRVGYGLYLVAIIAFGVGAVGRFTDLIVTVTMAALGLGSLVLLPAIVLGYAVRAADREDRESRS